jgi:hypothetical protein
MVTEIRPNKSRPELNSVAILTGIDLPAAAPAA